MLNENKALDEKLSALEERLHNPKAEVTYDILAMKGGAKLYSQLSVLYDIVNSGDGPPTQGMTERTGELERDLESYDAQLETIEQEDLSKLNDLARKLRLPIIWVSKK